MSKFGQINFDPSYTSAFGTLHTAELTPVIQSDFAYGINNQIWQQTYTFTVTNPATDPVAGDVYTNNNQSFTVIYNSTTTLVCSGTGNPAASGNLTRASGAGTTPIAFSAYTVTNGVVFSTGATIDSSSQRLRLQSGTGSTAYAYIQSRKPARYRPGQGTEARFTGLFSTGSANNIQVWGMGSIVNNALYDGYFFGYNGTAFGIAHYVRGSATWTAQTAWNGDKVDGSAGSSFTYNPVNGTPLKIVYPYLGYGDIMFFVQNPDTGAWVLVHMIKFANSATTTQLSNPTLNFIGYTLNSGNTTNKTMYCGSVGVFISGERSYVGNPKGTLSSSKSGITTETNLLTLQNCSTYNTVTNKGMIRLQSVSVASSAASGTAVFRFKIGATLGGTPSYTAYNGTATVGGVVISSGQSVVSYDTAGTTVTGGTGQYSISVDNPNSTIINLKDEDLFIPPGETLTISAESTNSATMGVSINWTEDI